MVLSNSASNFRHLRLSFGVNGTTQKEKKRHDEVCMIEEVQKSGGEVRPRKASSALRICQQAATRGLGTSRIKCPAPDSWLVGLPPVPEEIAWAERPLDRLRPERKT
jgi:hypothetical protein